MATPEIQHRMIALLPRLRAFARSLARSRDAADDLVQTTCEKALRALDSWQEGTRLDTWMFRIMRNAWIDTVRARRPTASLDEHMVTDLIGEDGSRTADARLELHAVRRAIDTLPDEQREVLVLVCVEELSYRETAEVLGIPIGTVMSRLSRARRGLMEDTSVSESAGEAR